MKSLKNVFLALAVLLMGTLCVMAFGDEEPPGGGPESEETNGLVELHVVRYVCPDGSWYECTYIKCPTIFFACSPSFCYPDPGCTNTDYTF